MKVKSLSPVQLLATPGTAAYQAPPPMGFSRPEYWSGVPVLSLKYTCMHNLKKDMQSSAREQRTNSVCLKKLSLINTVHTNLSLLS